MKIAVWFSCGAASAVAAYETLKQYRGHEIHVLNCYVKEEDEDNRRFLRDVEMWLGVTIETLVSLQYPSGSAVEVWEKRRYMSGVMGAPCTGILKKDLRYDWTKENNPDYHVLGFTSEESNRHRLFVKAEIPNVLPVLIDAGITKDECYRIIQDAGIKLPRVYSLGYPNANCIGCVKATSPTYWNLVRKNHPLVFAERAEQSRRLGCRLVRVSGQRKFLDELKESDNGRKLKSMPDCGIVCMDTVDAVLKDKRKPKAK